MRATSAPSGFVSSSRRASARPRCAACSRRSACPKTSSRRAAPSWRRRSTARARRRCWAPTRLAMRRSRLRWQWAEDDRHHLITLTDSVYPQALLAIGYRAAGAVSWTATRSHSTARRWRSSAAATRRRRARASAGLRAGAGRGRAADLYRAGGGRRCRRASRRAGRPCRHHRGDRHRVRTVSIRPATAISRTRSRSAARSSPSCRPARRRRDPIFRAATG